MVWLYQKILEIIEIKDVLTSGNITNTDLEGPIAGKIIMNLTQSTQLGKTYVNVHRQDRPNGI